MIDLSKMLEITRISAHFSMNSSKSTVFTMKYGSLLPLSCKNRYKRNSTFKNARFYNEMLPFSASEGSSRDSQRWLAGWLSWLAGLDDIFPTSIA